MLNRRTFIASSAGLSVLAAAPSDTVRLGVLGTGGRGNFVMAAFGRIPSVQIMAVCDVYEPNLERGIAAASPNGTHKASVYRHYLDLLNDKDVDAVLIATPEHWHHRMILDTLAAGKDIYVEKPLCHTPEQGAELVAAEKSSKQIVQCGMQRRSYDLFLRAKQIMDDGSTLGKVRMIRSWWLNNYLGAERVTKLDGKLDWDAWQGPAPRRPFDPDRFRNWRYYSDYAGGILADQGAHVFDGIHMLMGSGPPVSVVASAGRPHRAGFDTPESVNVAACYSEDYIAVFTINYATMKYPPPRDQLNQFDGDNGRLDVGREDLSVYRQGSDDKSSDSYKSQKGFGYATDLHVANFIDCVRTRKKTTAPIVLGFQATLAVQMANLSLKHGREIRWNAASQKVEM
ncbi:MAG TPA: Gfo/Idh/MocA family oxidoreductase [Bryobacteraceae bacterium]|nr:Gfo/Idh/MocA family oxidoreductase [Bryobacteraceae bacterium]